MEIYTWKMNNQSRRNHKVAKVLGFTSFGLQRPPVILNQRTLYKVQISVKVPVLKDHFQIWNAAIIPNITYVGDHTQFSMRQNYSCLLGYSNKKQKKRLQLQEKERF